MQETLQDLDAQKKENTEEKDGDVSSNFAYRSATREIAINVKVSSNHFIKSSLNICSVCQTFKIILK